MVDISDAPALRRGQQEKLLALARDAILARLSRGAGAQANVVSASTDSAFEVDCGAFVSLHVEGEQRGCIGSVHAMAALGQTVADMAVAAATDDGRFPAMTSAEMRYADIEISVLSGLNPCRPQDVEVGTHGVLIARKSKRGVLLPQVSEQYGWDRERFLGEACRKAGLPLDAWKTDSDVHVMVFTAQVFSESDFEEPLPES